MKETEHSRLYIFVPVVPTSVYRATPNGDWAWFLPRFILFCLFSSGLIRWGHFISSDFVDLIAQILLDLNWADIPESNDELHLTENWVSNLVIIDTILIFNKDQTCRNYK